MTDDLNTLLTSLVTLVNRGESLHNGIAEFLSRQHRTLQQSLIKELLLGLVKHGENSWYDDRNKASIMCLRKIKPIIDETSFPYI